MALVSRPNVSRVVAACAVTDTEGDFVHLSVGGPGVVTVEKVDITDATKMPSVGVIISKGSPNVCLVQTGGLVRGVYAGLTPGKLYYAGFDAQPVSVVPAPSEPNPRVYVQPVGFAASADTLLLQPLPIPIARVL